jgi:hypothetical protein
MVYCFAQKITRALCKQQGVPDYFKVISQPMDLIRLEVRSLHCALFSHACSHACMLRLPGKHEQVEVQNV